jgi:amino acid transporter
VNYVTAEFKNPARDLPRVIHTSLPLVILCYILANISYFLVLPTSVIESSNTVAVAFGAQVFGPVGALILALFVSGSCFGALNATTFTSGRLVYAAGKEGYMPGLFGTIGLGKSHRAIRLNAQTASTSKVPQKLVSWFADADAGFFFTPISAMLLNAAITAVYILIGSFDTLVTFYGVAGYTFYFQTVLGLIILRVREPDLERPYKTWITTPIIFCCVSLFLLSRAVFAEPVQTLLVVAFMAVGLAIWFAWVGRRRGKERQRFRNMESGGSEKGVGWQFWKRWTG